MVVGILLLLALCRVPATMAGEQREQEGQKKEQATIEGWVLDSRDAPLAGAELFVIEGFSRREGEKGRRVARSDAEGRIAWKPAPTGQWLVLRAELPGYLAAELQVAPLDPGETRDRLRWELGRLMRGVGRVVDVDDRPIAGVTVRSIDPELEEELKTRSRREGEDLVRGEATTDARGVFELADLVPGFFDLEARARGRVPLRIRGVQIPELEGAVDLGTLVLASGVVLEGRVVDTVGEPLAGISIWIGGEHRTARFGPWEEEPPDTRTDADGRFTSSEHAPGEQVRVLATGEGRLPRRSPWFEVPLGEPLELVLPAAATVRGVVSGPDGEPVAGASVQLDSSPGEEAVEERLGILLPRSTFCGDDGRFELLGVPAGASTLVAKGPGHLPARLPLSEVPEGGLLEGIEVILEAGATLAGRVTDRRGAPLADINVQIRKSSGFSQRRTVRTNTEGQYELGGLATGPHLAVARTPQGREQRVSVEIMAGANALDFELEPEEGVEIGGRVLDAAGRPVGGAYVRLEPEDGRDGDSSRLFALSRDDGSFRIAAVPPGSYRLHAGMEPGTFSPEGRKLEVGSTPLSGVEVVVEQGLSITGRVLGLDAEELARVKVSHSWASNDFVRSDHGGIYRLDGLPKVAMPVTVVAVVGENERSTARQITLDPEVPLATFDLVFEDGHTLSGRLSSGAQVLEGFHVICFDIGTRASCGRTTSSPEGLFELNNVAAGRYQLFVADATETPIHWQDLIVGGDEEIELELATGVLAGVVTQPDGAPAVGARIQLERVGASLPIPRRLSGDPEGRFSFRWVGAGEWILSARQPGFAQAQQRLLLEEGESHHDLDLVLASPTRLTLDLRGGGHPVSGSFQVVFLDATETAVAVMNPTADDQGRAILDQVPEGQWRMVLLVWGGTWAQTERSVSVPGGSVVVELVAGGLLRVRRPDWLDPAEQIFVELVGPDGRPHTWITGSPTRRAPMLGDELRAAGLAVGRWTVRLSTDEGESWSAMAVVTPGEYTSVDFESASEAP